MPSCVSYAPSHASYLTVVTVTLKDGPIPGITLVPGLHVPDRSTVEVNPPLLQRILLYFRFSSLTRDVRHRGFVWKSN